MAAAAIFICVFELVSVENEHIFVEFGAYTDIQGSLRRCGQNHNFRKIQTGGDWTRFGTSMQHETPTRITQ